MTKSTCIKIVEEPEKKKRKRFNKNKKKAWRKKIDITDIENALDDQRREERYGGALGERKSSDLFEVDIGSNISKGISKKKVLKKTKKLKVKRLKCHEFLDGLPGVKPIRKKRTPGYQYPSKVMRTAINRSGDTLKDSIKRMIAKDQQKEARKKNQQKPKLRNPVREDIWECGPPKENKNESGMISILGKGFLESGLKHYEDITKETLVKAPKIRAEKPNLIPAVIIPHAGSSYNPTLRDHQELMLKAIKEDEKEKWNIMKKKKIHEKYVISAKNAPSIETYLKEMSAGLGPENDTDVNDVEEDPQKITESSAISVSAARVTEKKSKKQRIKELQNRLLEKQKINSKARKIEQNNVFKVKSYMKEIKLKDEEKVRKSERMKKKKEEEKFKTKRVTKNKFKEPATEVYLGDALPENMNNIKPIGNPIADRIVSLQRRNVVLLGSKAKRTKRKTKSVYKRHLQLKDGLTTKIPL